MEGDFLTILKEKDIKHKLKYMYNGEYELVGSYKGMGKPITLKHKICETVYTRRKANMFFNENEGLCPKCNIKRSKRRNYKKISEEEFKKEIKNEDPNYEYISDYKNKSHEKFKIKHLSCGNEYYVSPHDFFGKRKRRCPNCANNKRGPRKDSNYLEDILKITPYGNGDEFKWLENYNQNNKERLLIQHQCGETQRVMPNTVQYYGISCPKCQMYGKSLEEKEIVKFIKENYNGKINENYKDKYEIDIFLPEFNLGIEYNGFYWHSDKFKDKNYHLKKHDYFKEKGIEIFFIYSNDWIDKKEIIKNRILNKIGKTKNRLYARKLKLDLYNVNTNEEKLFLNSNHIQGYAISSYKFALRDGDEIVSLLTFIKKRNNVNSSKNDRIELLRYATKKDYSIVGGFSRLLKHAEDFLKNEGYNYIFSYAYKDYSSGNLYFKNNFKLINETKPSYFYVYKNKKENRYKFRKSELKKNFPEYYNESKTEIQIADSIPQLFRVWNCGNYVFEKRIN